MKKNVIIGIAWGVGIVALFVLLGTDGSKIGITSDTSAGVVELDSNSYDFGTIDIFGGDVTADFILTNTGNEAVTVLSGTTSCGCTEGQLGGYRFGMHAPMGGRVAIGPGESEVLTAIYDPLAHGPDATGRVTREIILDTDSAQTPELRARISANVVKNQ